MEQQFNREAEEGWRLAADAARITDERASSEGKRTSGIFFCLSTATWEQWWEQKKVRLLRSQVMKEELPRHG